MFAVSLVPAQAASEHAKLESAGSAGAAGSQEIHSDIEEVAVEVEPEAQEHVGEGAIAPKRKAAAKPAVEKKAIMRLGGQELPEV